MGIASQAEDDKYFSSFGNRDFSWNIGVDVSYPLGVRKEFLEVERAELERQVEEALQGYEVLIDSLDHAHDSIAEVRAQAAERASDASRSFEEGVGVLRDSLEAYDGLETILNEIEYDHRIEVQAYQEQIETLEADKALLRQRVTALDSMWVREQEVNDALRREITALNEEADAWEALATPSIISRVNNGSVVDNGPARSLL